MTITGGGLCADTVISCRNLTSCRPDNITCSLPNTICVNNTKCGFPVCYPLELASFERCPPFGAQNISNVTGTTTISTAATTTTTKAADTTTSTSFFGLCSDQNSTSKAPVLQITFGSGVNQFSSKTPADFNFTTTHKQVNDTDGIAIGGNFAFVNAVPYHFAFHVGALDHTPNDTSGYMYLLNADVYPGLIFNTTINNLTVGQRYEFSVYGANLVKPANATQPNILFEVRTAATNNKLIAQLSSGNMSEYNTMTWAKYGISFVAPNTSVVLLLISNSFSGYGNDLVLDDFTLRAC